jgi:hypothetical protein
MVVLVGELMTGELVRLFSRHYKLAALRRMLAENASPWVQA